jgi:putative spermidine/putrescine transport system ATP-binding protein
MQDFTPGLTLDGISHRYGTTRVVDDVTLRIARGELVALLGPSGCGKTTLLKIVAGFVRQQAGHVAIAGTAVDALPPNRRRVGIVFQNYALFPHMTVAANVAYGLDVMRMGRAEKARRVSEMLGLVRMDRFADRYPRQLSGGQQQRVAIARALAIGPGVLLLDEPFAALDKGLRLDMQIEVKRIQRSAGTTTVLVTHDQEEALSLADRVAVLNQGRLEQFAPPSTIYDQPASLFVNGFVGSATMLPGTVAASDARTLRIRLDAGGTWLAAAGGARLDPGDRAVLCARPEAIGFASDADPIAETIPAEVELGLPLGASIVHELRLDGGAALKMSSPRRPGDEPLPPGTRVRLRQTAPGTAFPAP